MITKRELFLLYQYARKCKFIIETGGGLSTSVLANATIKKGGFFISIEINPKVMRRHKRHKLSNVRKMHGWSVRYEDLMLPGHEHFIKTKSKNYSKVGMEHKIIFSSKKVGKKIMKERGRTDLIRKALLKYKNIKLDFFFCDSGEYFGLPEWNVVKDEIKVGGYFAIHDIYFPKSIKGYKVLKKIQESYQWKVVEQTPKKHDKTCGIAIAIKTK